VSSLVTAVSWLGVARSPPPPGLPLFPFIIGADAC
jgi:hypothetical protein